MLYLDKKKHLGGYCRRVSQLERSKKTIFISSKGQGEINLMLVKANKTKVQAAKGTDLTSSPNGNQEMVKETEVINHLAATWEQETVPSARHKIVGGEHRCNLVVSISIKVGQRHEGKYFVLFSPFGHRPILIAQDDSVTPLNPALTNRDFCLPSRAFWKSFRPKGWPEGCSPFLFTAVQPML